MIQCEGEENGFGSIDHGRYEEWYIDLMIKRRKSIP
jgi:hypothetical protein